MVLPNTYCEFFMPLVVDGVKTYYKFFMSLVVDGLVVLYVIGNW